MTLIDAGRLLTRNFLSLETLFPTFDHLHGTSHLTLYLSLFIQKDIKDNFSVIFKNVFIVNLQQYSH